MHQCFYLDHMTHSGSSDHESMSWSLEGGHRRGDQMEINTSDGLTAWASAAGAGHSLEEEGLHQLTRSRLHTGIKKNKQNHNLLTMTITISAIINRL